MPLTLVLELPPKVAPPKLEVPENDPLPLNDEVEPAKLLPALDVEEPPLPASKLVPPLFEPAVGAPPLAVAPVPVTMGGGWPVSPPIGGGAGWSPSPQAAKQSHESSSGKAARE